MRKYTLGPWTTEDTSGGTVILAYSGVETICIAKLTVNMLGDSNQANARLIAAAPDLLEVARLILTEWERPTEGVKAGELIARLSQYASEAKAAISKAEGQ